MSFQTPTVNGILVKDEGVTIANPANSIDFAGAGVVASASQGNVTVTIAGGTAASEARNETPAGLVNSSNTIFTTAHAFTAGTLQVYLNGIRLQVTSDYTITGASQFTFLTAPDTGSIITVDYLY